MTFTDDRETAAPEVTEVQSSPILFGQGQAAWLAVVTLVAGLALVVSFIALVEANSGGGGGSGAAADAARSGPTTEPTISFSDFAFDPERVEVVAGETLAVTLDNGGGVEHNWTVLNSGEEIAAEADFDESMVLFASDDVAAGDQATGELELETGDYQVICTIAGHFDLGMKGTVAAL